MTLGCHGWRASDHFQWRSVSFANRHGQRREGFDDFPVDVALEGHDQVHELGCGHPFPGNEFGVVSCLRRYVDLALVSRETIEKPALLLPAIAAAPGLADKVRRQVVNEPARQFGEGDD